jgi:hypothetical protein
MKSSSGSKFFGLPDAEAAGELASRSDPMHLHAAECQADHLDETDKASEGMP